MRVRSSGGETPSRFQSVPEVGQIRALGVAASARRGYVRSRVWSISSVHCDSLPSVPDL